MLIEIHLIKRMGYLLFLILLYEHSMSQALESRQSFVQPSPEAYSLGKYGFVSNSKYTGQVHLSYPIHEIEFKDRKFPVALEYSQSGLRILEEASWVGAGWSLTSSPIITRQINGEDDLKPISGYVNQPDFDLESHSVLSLPEELVTDISANGNNIRRKPDTEPDIFVVNIFGESIRFVLISKAQNNNAIGVKMLNSLTYKASFDESARSFTIVDNKGYAFIFNSKEVSTTGSYQLNGIDYLDETDPYEVVIQDTDNDVDIITSWYCDTVVAPDGDELTFQYERLARSMTQPSIVGYKEAVVCGGTVNYNPKQGLSWSRTATDHLYLSKITNGLEEIDFYLADRYDLTRVNFDARTYDFIGAKADNSLLAKRLAKVTVSFNDVDKKEVFFYHSYFNEDKFADSQKDRYLRLKLDKVKIQ